MKHDPNKVIENPLMKGFKKPSVTLKLFRRKAKNILYNNKDILSESESLPSLKNKSQTSQKKMLNNNLVINSLSRCDKNINNRSISNDSKIKVQMVNTGVNTDVDDNYINMTTHNNFEDKIFDYNSTQINENSITKAKTKSGYRPILKINKQECDILDNKYGVLNDLKIKKVKSFSKIKNNVKSF